MASANTASVQLWASKDGDLNYTRLDLFPEEPIKLTLSVTDIMDPLATTSIFSRTFRVPNTQANNAFFKAVFNVNSVSFDASKKVSAYLNDSGSFYTNGNIRLMSVYSNDRDGDVQYEIVFMGETSDFGGQIGGGFLSDVNLAEYTHDQTYLNITNSWNTNSAGIANGLFNGDIVYPLCNWGYTYEAGQPQQSTTSLYTGSAGGLYGFTDSNHPLDQSQMKPSIRAKALWDKIFAETEYTYQSTFLESEFFSKMYILSEKQSRPQLDILLSFQADNVAAQNYSQTGVVLGQLFAPHEITDPNGVWNNLTSIYTVKATSGLNYEFALTFNDRVTPFSSAFQPVRQMTYTVSLRDADTYNILSQSILTGNSLIAGTRTIFWNLPLTQGQRVLFTIEPSLVIPANAVAGIRITNFTASQTAGPEIVTINSVMPDNIRKIDFMRSIINRFKLVFVPSTVNEKHFEITPWKDWILEGTSYDWNSLLDTSKDIKSTPLFYGQNRFQIYSDQEDSDFPNYTYQLSYKQTYGQLNLDSDNELLNGTITIKDQFAPTPIYPIGGAVPGLTGSAAAAANFLIPWLSKADFTAVQNNPIQPKLRLVFYNGKQTAPLYWYLEDDFGYPTVQTVYPLMSEYSYWPVDTASFDLSWRNIAPLYDVAVALNPIARTNYDTFNVYWKTWYDTNFDPYSRKVELTLILDYSSILNLKFNNYYFIKDAWYFVNKVTDYVVGETSACKVELIKVGNNIGLTIPPTAGQGYPQGLCYVSSDTANYCDAYCCAQYQLTGLYYSDSSALISSSTIWQDSFKTNPANPGFYASAAGVVFSVANGGFITEFFDGTTCEPCSGAVLNYFPNCCQGDSVCESCCCDGTILDLWTDGATLDTSFNVYTNAGGTAAAANGWYKDPINPDYTVNVQDGTVWAVGLCSTCDCGGPAGLYEKTAFFTSTSDPVCDACTQSVTLATVWLDTNDWATASTIYTNDSIGATGASGYWRAIQNDLTYITNNSGAITGAADCSVCTSIYYYLGRNCNANTLFQNFSSEVTIDPGQVVSSALFPGQCWEIISSAASGYPIDVIHDNCNSCSETWVCNCLEYSITTYTKYSGYIAYTDCTTGTQLYQEIIPGNNYSICMCEDSAQVIQGNLDIQLLGTCVTPPCYVWNLTVTPLGANGVVEYEECVTGLTQTIAVAVGGEYSICAVDGTVVALSGNITITQLAICG